jgi:hypothetical protein
MTGSVVAVSALLPSKGFDGQREPGGVGEQPNGDLRFQSPLFAEAGLTEPIAGVGFEVRRGDVVQHQRRRPQPGAVSARS